MTLNKLSLMLPPNLTNLVARMSRRSEKKEIKFRTWTKILLMVPSLQLWTKKQRIGISNSKSMRSKPIIPSKALLLNQRRHSNKEVKMPRKQSRQLSMKLRKL